MATKKRLTPSKSCSMAMEKEAKKSELMIIIDEREDKDTTKIMELVRRFTFDGTAKSALS
jgi:hypothetical protein